MKQKILIGLLTITSLFFISGYLKRQKYKNSISNISNRFYKEFTLKGTLLYDKGDINCFLIFNSNCELCIDEIEDIVDNIALFKNVNFYLVSNQKEDKLIEYNTDSEFLGLKNFTILQDKNEVISKFFNSSEKPSLFVYSKSGNLIKYKKGYVSFVALKKMLGKTN